MLIDVVALKTIELLVNTSMICNNVGKYEEYLMSEVSTFIINIANKAVTFESE